MVNKIVIKSHSRFEKKEDSWQEKIVITEKGITYKKTYNTVSSLLDYNSTEAYAKVNKTWSYNFGKHNTDLPKVEESVLDDIYNELLKVKENAKGKKLPSIDIIVFLGEGNAFGYKSVGTLSAIDEANDTILAVLLGKLVPKQEGTLNLI